MHAGPDVDLPLRLAHSHREKAQALLQDCARRLAEGAIDQARHDILAAEYQRELAEAEASIARFRKLDSLRLETLAAELLAAQDEQAHLGDRVSAGQISAQQANDRNRALLKKIEGLEHERERLRASSDAQSAEQLGGFIDLPFVQYAEQIAAAARMPVSLPPGSGAPAKRWELGLVALAAATATIAVFLTWISHGNENLSLFRAGLEIAPPESGAATGSPARLAWVLYVAVPWSGLVILLRARGRLIGWGVLGAGLLLLSGGIIPGILTGASRVYGEDLNQILAAYRPGAILYMVAAVVFIVVGALRISPWSDSLVHAVYVSTILAAGVAAIFLLWAAVILMTPTVGRATFDTSVVGPAKDTVTLSCRNIGKDPVSLYVPWPEGGPDSVAGLDRLSSYGVSLYAKEEDKGDFRLLPYSRQPWSTAGAPMLETESLQISPGMTEEVHLDLRQLSVLGADARAVRLVYTRGDGAAMGAFETDLSGQYLSPRAEERQPLLVPKPPAAPVQIPGVSEEPKDQTSAPSAPAPAPAGTVTYAGTVGDRVILRVGGAGGASETRLVAVGDLVADGWYLDSISNAPSAIVLRREPSGTTATLRRGETSALAQAP